MSRYFEVLVNFLKSSLAAGRADRGTHKDAIPWDSRGLAKALKVKVAELLE